MHSLCIPARPASKNIIDYIKGNITYVLLVKFRLNDPTG